MTVVAKENMTCKEVEIELSARSEQNGFFGAYFCLACRTGQVKYEPLLPEPNDAIEEARVLAMEHCKDKH